MLSKIMTDNAHFLIQEAIKEREPASLIAIDATMGNGMDLCFLAQCPNIGRVIGFDIQSQAVAASYEKVKAFGSKVELILNTHAELLHYVQEVDVVMFNLGYLPHGSKNCTTQKESSLKAIQAALKCLNPQGIMTIITYPGHEEGKREHEAIQEYLSTKLPAQFLVLQMISCNVKGQCPVLFMIRHQS
ncbi:16S rRNA (cytosine(1402)-N(4))-methyltransferase [Sporanaerobium hydrogeniformans]|uniref:16S rRNA (Cytosine(1402)-N(4))-methyltransferase n=1 Tax=Sporanaerobium hydrogeniformans TaxID=3072179 RepID=A0AC61DEE5_9FIRM|nr:class I SAM-dependent methyltransferase [Sporanaerobium hydrogeniformans]PHV71158.1 16S rRNA (cytosine(1402)-N(4))-methyltransferase [Sporanaerobium hydrogeniformans]